MILIVSWWIEGRDKMKWCESRDYWAKTSAQGWTQQDTGALPKEPTLWGIIRHVWLAAQKLLLLLLLFKIIITSVLLWLQGNEVGLMLHVGRPLLFLWRRIIQMSRRQHRHSTWKQCQFFSATANDKLEAGWRHERVKKSSLFSSDNSAVRWSVVTASYSVWFGTNTRPFKN